jgi:hypothetical protein
MRALAEEASGIMRRRMAAVGEARLLLNWIAPSQIRGIKYHPAVRRNPPWAVAAFGFVVLVR